MPYSTTPQPLADTDVKWEVFLQQRDGRQIIPLTDLVIRGHLFLSLNGLGSFSLEFSLEKLRAKGYNDIPDDMMLEFVRKHGVTRSFSFYKRKSVRTRDTLIIAGFGLNHLIKRRVVAYFAESSQAQKTDYLDDMMKAVITENMTASAVHFETGATETARDYNQVVTFTVAPDDSQAPSDTMSFAWDNCYAVCRKIADNSTQQGTRLYFGIERTGDTSYEFRTYTGLMGIDRRAEKTFGNESGNLSGTEYMRDASDTLTYLYVAGRGEAATRKVSEVAEHDALDAFTRIEGVYNATNSPDTSLPALGYQQLRKNRPVETFKGELVSNEKAFYGVDWDLGDMLDAKDGDTEFSIMVNGIEMYFGKTEVSGRFEVIPDE